MVTCRNPSSEEIYSVIDNRLRDDGHNLLACLHIQETVWNYISYTKTDTHVAGLDLFFYSESYFHHSDVPCPPNDVVVKASNNLVSIGVSETDG